jgi:hypothetical protein
MLGLLERNIATIERRLVLVAPPRTTPPDVFRSVTVDAAGRTALIRQMQAFRGQTYLNAGYLTRQQLSPSGLHQTPEDERSWHLVMTDDNGNVTSCAWYLRHENTTSVEHLRVRNCPLARLTEWRDKLYAAVESEIARARRNGLHFAELGGWAVSTDRRFTTDCLVLALATYGLSMVLGGGIGMTTANVNHSSSSILQRLGGSYLESDGTPLPAYFDPKYNATIELLRFDSRRPNSKYARLIELVRGKLLNVSVIASGAASQSNSFAWTEGPSLSAA